MVHFTYLKALGTRVAVSDIRRVNDTRLHFHWLFIDGQSKLGNVVGLSKLQRLQQRNVNRQKPQDPLEKLPGFLALWHSFAPPASL